MLTLVPITIKDANALVTRWHRHSKRRHKARFAVAVAEGDRICGAAIIGDPTARMRDDGWTAEVLRLVTDGTKNVCSMLYAAAWRAARALGFRRMGTYILCTESGVSVSAAGWVELYRTSGGSWDRASRPRVDDHETCEKLFFGVGDWEKAPTRCAPSRPSVRNTGSKC